MVNGEYKLYYFSFNIFIKCDTTMTETVGVNETILYYKYI